MKQFFLAAKSLMLTDVVDDADGFDLHDRCCKQMWFTQLSDIPKSVKS